LHYVHDGPTALSKDGYRRAKKYINGLRKQYGYAEGEEYLKEKWAEGTANPRANANYQNIVAKPSVKRVKHAAKAKSSAKKRA
jgi:hypothetical protein